jgi:hypothetical protein
LDLSAEMLPPQLPYLPSKPALKKLPRRLAATGFAVSFHDAQTGLQLSRRTASITRPLAYKGWSRIIFRRDLDGQRRVVPLEDLLEHLPDSGRAPLNRW